MRTPRLQVSRDVLFAAVALPAFAFMLWARWQRIARFRPGSPIPRRLRHMLMIAPHHLLRAFFIAFLATVIVELVVKLIVEPLVVRWLVPRRYRDDAPPREFALAANEAIVAESPARLAVDRKWLPGTLALTDRRLFFFPRGWNSETWSLSLPDLTAIHAHPAPRHTHGLITGMPDRLAFRSRDGSEATLALADPDAVVAWFETPRA
ncbi:MAG TPA: hypothetical protein VG406_05285 [Isosphaeraceae bacterium]|jgi:hypothetical protein|nr:hypothetical protein [Isosphaeraceae bacterium]